MARDEEKLEAEHRSKIQDIELRKFMESFSGRKHDNLWVRV
jgi:hypothetical protein